MQRHIAVPYPVGVFAGELAVPPLARAFVLLGKLSILVILEVPLARLLDLTPLEVLAQLAFGVIKGIC